MIVWQGWRGTGGVPAVLEGIPSIHTCSTIIVPARAAQGKQMQEDMLKKEQGKIRAPLQRRKLGRNLRRKLHEPTEKTKSSYCGPN